MIRFAASWAPRRGAGLILALLLGGLATPAAHAGCGDHLLAHRVDAAAEESAPQTPPRPATPCHGPSCSRPEQLPLTTAAVKFVLPEQHARLSLPLQTDPDVGRSGWRRGDDPTRPVRPADPIFHPPR